MRGVVVRRGARRRHSVDLALCGVLQRGVGCQACLVCGVDPKMAAGVMPQVPVP